MHQVDQSTYCYRPEHIPGATWLTGGRLLLEAIGLIHTLSMLLKMLDICWQIQARGWKASALLLLFGTIVATR